MPRRTEESETKGGPRWGRNRLFAGLTSAHVKNVEKRNIVAKRKSTNGYTCLAFGTYGWTNRWALVVLGVYFIRHNNKRTH